MRVIFPAKSRPGYWRTRTLTAAPAAIPEAKACGTFVNRRSGFEMVIM